MVLQDVRRDRNAVRVQFDAVSEQRVVVRLARRILQPLRVHQQQVDRVRRTALVDADFSQRLAAATEVEIGKAGEGAEREAHLRIAAEERVFGPDAVAGTGLAREGRRPCHVAAQRVVDRRWPGLEALADDRLNRAIERAVDPCRVAVEVFGPLDHDLTLAGKDLIHVRAGAAPAGHFLNVVAPGLERLSAAKAKQRADSLAHSVTNSSHQLFQISETGARRPRPASTACSPAISRSTRSSAVQICS